MLRDLKEALFEPDNPRLVQRQALTLLLLVTGYAGYYLCRSNLSVAMPYIIADMVLDGYDPAYAKTAMGRVASAGVLAYAIGKFLSGGLADRIGGRRTFLYGMGGSVAATMMFALSGTVPMFTLAWLVNRTCQTGGWIGMVKLTSRWFSASSYGTAMGVLSLSYMFGDAAARAFMGTLLSWGLDWAGVFFIGAAILLTLLVLNAVLLLESPAEIGEPEPRGGTLSLIDDDDAPQAGEMRVILRRFLRNRSFLAICAISLGFTLIRETFNTWTPLYFAESTGMSGSEAAQGSALFPFSGGISVLLAGFVSDRLGPSGRASIILGGLGLTALALLVLGRVDLSASPMLPVLMVGFTGFVMIGPYSYLSGAMALDLGGKRASATAAGIIDGVGYLGGVLAGDAFARLSVHLDWQGAWGVLAAVAVLSCIPAAILWNEEQPRRPIRRFT